MRYRESREPAPASLTYGLRPYSRAAGVQHFRPDGDWDDARLRGTTVYLLHGLQPHHRFLSVLYVGISDQPVTRWATHRREQPWWPQVQLIEQRICATRDEALDHEADLIEALDPPYNGSGTRYWQRRRNRPLVMRAIESAVRRWSVPS